MLRPDPLLLDAERRLLDEPAPAPRTPGPRGQLSLFDDIVVLPTAAEGGRLMTTQDRLLEARRIDLASFPWPSGPAPLVGTRLSPDRRTLLVVTAAPADGGRRGSDDVGRSLSAPRGVPAAEAEVVAPHVQVEQFRSVELGILARLQECWECFFQPRGSAESCRKDRVRVYRDVRSARWRLHH